MRGATAMHRRNHNHSTGITILHIIITILHIIIVIIIIALPSH
eukprot:COSAG05_NODE_5046_length_1280_cov_6.022862_2_plen_43_part_00